MATTFLAKGRDRTCREVAVAGGPGGNGGGDLILTASVGVGGKNLRPDVLTVQKALNKVPAASGGPLPPLATDGWIGSNTNRAITKFQQHHFGAADGRVDPGLRTHAKLKEYQGTSPPGQSAPATGVPGSGGNPNTMAVFYARIEEGKQ